MKAIWKFKLFVCDKQRISMPRGAKPVSVQEQDSVLCMWAIVDPAEETIARTISIYGTGHEHDSISGDFIGTVQQGPFVWHLFID